MKETTPTTSTPDSAPAEQVLVLPGSLFFIETVEVPIELEVSEVPDFIELSLEAIAPFPIEQLNWGYLYSEGVSEVLIYATHRDRIKIAGYTDLESYAWVVPDFTTLTGACFPDETLVSLESATNLSLLHFDKGSSIPRTVLVAPITDETSAADTLKALKASAPSLPKTASTLRIRATEPVLNEQGLPIFHHESVEDSRSDHEYGSWTELAPSEAQLWQADVRSGEFKDSERSARRIGALLMRGTGWAAIFAIVLIVGELLLLGCETWIGSLDKQIESQRPAVLTIQDKQALMVKLEQVAQNELRPVALLEKASAMRPTGSLWIEYDSARVEGENNVTIEGKAASINALNNYTANLRKSGQFEIIEGPESITRGGKTTFTVTLSYSHIDEPEPVEATPEAANSDPRETPTTEDKQSETEEAKI